MYKSLREFISRLSADGELAVVSAHVDTEYEITEITDRECKREGGGRALLFTSDGTSFPVLTNMFGSERRMAAALGVDSLDDIPCRIESMAASMLSPRAGVCDKLRSAFTALQMVPRKVCGRGACQQVVYRGDDVDLSMLPILKCWPCDGGRFVTLPMVNTVDPETGTRNVGMYRMQVIDRRTTAMHWQIHKTGERHYRAYQRLGIQKMPVAVCLGGDPSYTYAATAPVPDGIDEYMLAGFLRDKPVRLVKCLTCDLRVPEDCDFVIEGYVDTTEPKTVEGAFGDHTGFYSLPDDYPLFHVTAITHRRDAVYPATLVGVPPMEDAYIAEATERVFLAPMRLALQPEIRDLYMPSAGVAHNLALMSIHTDYVGESRKVALSMWGAGQMMFCKCIVMLPETVNPRESDAVAELLRGFNVRCDVERARGVYDALDHSTATVVFGGKLLIDLTERREPRAVQLPSEMTLCGGIKACRTELTDKWSVLLLFAPYGTPVDLAYFLSCNSVHVNFVALFDESAFGLTTYQLLWIACGNTEPERDAKIIADSLTFDCRTKVNCEGAPERFPNVVVSSAETVAKVDSRSGEYGLGEQPESPSDSVRCLVYSDKASVR